MNFTIAELAEALDAELVGCSDSKTVVTGLSIDSRTIESGQMFAAVTDVRDGHDFVGDARAGGAAAVVVERRVDDGVSLVVGDVSASLGRLARLARGRLVGPVVGITGSVGKTTTKDMVAAVLSTTMVTAASQGSFNNELGVPITLANAPDDARATVVEMGARGRGHVEFLCSMAQPTVGVVTRVAAVHTEVMGDEDQIARVKGELIESLPCGGLAVLNSDDPRVAAMAALSSARVITFSGGAETGQVVRGSGDVPDVRASAVSLDDELRARFTLDSPWGSMKVHLGARGIHNVGNAVAAATVGLWAGVAPDDVVSGLAEPLASRWRMELNHGRSGVVVLNDAYNAGPTAMEAALRSLVAMRAERHLAVLGVMAELGDRAEREHAAIAALSSELGIEIIAVDTDLYGVESVARGDVVARIRAESILGPGTAVLVKGSRVAGLETVADALLAAF